MDTKMFEIHINIQPVKAFWFLLHFSLYCFILGYQEALNI